MSSKSWLLNLAWRSVAHLGDENHSLADVLLHLSAPKCGVLVFLFLGLWWKSVWSVPFVPTCWIYPVVFVLWLSSAHWPMSGVSTFILPWRLIVRIQPAMGVERPERILAVATAGDERASWGWDEILNPYSILWATGNHWKLSCRYVACPLCTLSICQSAEQKVVEVGEKGY